MNHGRPTDTHLVLVAALAEPVSLAARNQRGPVPWPLARPSPVPGHHDLRNSRTAGSDLPRHHDTHADPLPTGDCWRAPRPGATGPALAWPHPKQARDHGGTPKSYGSAQSAAPAATREALGPTRPPPPLGTSHPHARRRGESRSRTPAVLGAEECVGEGETGRSRLRPLVTLVQRRRGIVKSCGSARPADHAATSPSCASLSTSTPFRNVAPVRTSATRCAPLT